MNWVERKARAAERKRQLAAQLDSNELLLLGIRFYTGILTPGRSVDAAKVHARYKQLPRRVKTHLRGVRRLLGVAYIERGRLMRLPLCFWKRLRAIGLDWSDFDERERFESLNTALKDDEAVKAFALSHPILEAARTSLRGPEPVKTAVPRPQLDSYATHLQHHVMENVREHLLFGRE